MYTFSNIGQKGFVITIPHEQEFKWSSCRHSGQFQVTVFSRFCYVLLCNHEYIHCLNHRQAKDYITRCNETERKF